MPLVQRQRVTAPETDSVAKRPFIFYIVVVLLGVIFTGRLFYLEIIKGEHYRKEALAEHQKKFEIPARRGVIYAHDGNKLIPIVLNDTRRLIYADDRYVHDINATAATLHDVIGGKESNYRKL